MLITILHLSLTITVCHLVHRHARTTPMAMGVTYRVLISQGLITMLLPCAAPLRLPPIQSRLLRLRRTKPVTDLPEHHVRCTVWSAYTPGLMFIVLSSRLSALFWIQLCSLRSSARVQPRPNCHPAPSQPPRRFFSGLSLGRSYKAKGTPRNWICKP